MAGILVLLMFCGGAFAAGGELQAVYWFKGKLVTAEDYDFRKMKAELEGMAFRAVVTNVWPTGLVPVFGVERTNGFELRRRPPRGKEAGLEPLFFALPPEGEPEAGKVAGRWELEAVRFSGTKEYPVWELAIEGEKVSGRFDQNTDYRFAYVMGGTFVSNRLALRVEYINDAYVVEGTWQDGKMKGRWRREDGSEEGPWEGSRPPAAVTLPGSGKDVADLYEWRREADGSRRYGVSSPGAGWKRGERALCRVWRGR